MIIYNIGLPRTGTTTLKKALKILGFTMRSVYEINTINDGAWVGDFMNLPIDKYRDLYKKHPYAYFIMTMRSTPDIWYESVCKRSEVPYVKNNKGIAKQRKHMYGHETPFGHMRDYIECYKNHNYNATMYLKDRTKFKTFCWEDGDGWEELCWFLGVPVPDVEFPHLNKSKK